MEEAIKNSHSLDVMLKATNEIATLIHKPGSELGLKMYKKNIPLLPRKSSKLLWIFL